MPVIGCHLDGCEYSTPDVDAVIAAAIISAHVISHDQTTGNANASPAAKVEKVRRPTISSVGTSEEWTYFISRWNDYAEATKMTGKDKVIQLLGWCDDQLRKDLTRTADGTLTINTEAEVVAAMKRLAVQDENAMVARYRLHKVQMVLDKLDEAGLAVKMKKCEFGKSQVELLGYTVSAEEIVPQAQKVEVIKGLEYPNSKKEVKSFLGMTGYYRQCIPNNAYIPEPLVALTRDHIRLYWSVKEEEVFQKFKQELCSRNVMAYPDPEKPYILHTDATDYAVRAILTQEQQYVSKQLCKSQRAWAPIVKEAFAIIFALKKL